MKELVVDLIVKNTKLKKEDVEKLIETPPSPEMGDYSFPCFVLSKIEKNNPVDIARELSEQIQIPEGVEKIEAKGPYLNFFIAKENLAEETLSEILEQKEKYGSINIGNGKKALIEHTSINPNASPHVGRARNAIIGDSIVKMLKFQGFKPEVHYFVNDVGKQIAMLVLASRGKKKVDFDDLLELYIQINKKVEKSKKLEEEVFALLKKLEDGDKETKSQFKKFVETCLNGQKKILDTLGIKFDKFDYESEYLWNKRTTEILERLKKTKKLSKDEEGRMILNQKEYNIPVKSPVLVLTRSDGTSLYPLRDIAYTIDKMKAEKENNLLILGEDQKTYFMQIEAALNLLKEKSPKVVHYSFVLLTDGKMSTRQGNVVLLEDFMNEALKKARVEVKKREKVSGKELEKRARAITNAAVKYAILKVSAEKNIIFDLDSALSFEGDTGPYILYSYARARSILAKTKFKRVDEMEIDEVNEKEKQLINNMSKFPEVVKHAFSELAPNIIANYAFELAQKFNEFYHANKVIGSENEQFLLTLVDCFSIVLKNALSLLGIEVLEKM